jgi:hypothetical protein
MNPTLPTRLNILCKALLAAGATLFSACSTVLPDNETFVRTSITGSPDAPEWVRGSIPQSGGEIAFVGRGGAYNVLDERKAFDEAFMHARQQLAEYVSTRVVSECCDKDWARGARFLPYASNSGDKIVRIPESPDQTLQSRTYQLSQSIVGELLPSAQYWEQWSLDGSAHQQRYKCWVLATINRDSVRRFVDATVAVLKSEAELADAKNAIAEGKAKQEALMQANSQLAGALSAQNQEIQHLRERIHYGRAFRLTAKDNCAIQDPCAPLDRPQWRNAALDVNVTTQVQTIAVPAAPSPCQLPLGGN